MKMLLVKLYNYKKMLFLSLNNVKPSVLDMASSFFNGLRLAKDTDIAINIYIWKTDAISFGLSYMIVKG